MGQIPFHKVDEYTYEIPKSHRKDMRVPARFFASGELLKEIGKDRSLEQLVNTATIPGIERYALAMPDIHEGYGFPIGGVVATRVEDGLISPGGIGYDINCGVRLLASELSHEEVSTHLEKLATQIQRNVPTGLGRGGGLVLGPDRLDAVLKRGVDWMIDEGYAFAEDRIFCESAGRIPEADPSMVSELAKRRGRDQLGTLGSGNHFLEVQRVETIENEEVAAAFGLKMGLVVIMIHCGSRGLGHQVATDAIKRFIPKVAFWGFTLPDDELVGAPFSSREGQEYFRAMNAAANFAFSNRQMITHNVRKAWKGVLGDSGGELRLLYDVAHNIGKVERYDGKELLVHRKGATRAFGMNRAEIPAAYRGFGQPALIPGSMGTASYVLVGTKAAEMVSFGSTCHGAGRRLSRSMAKRTLSYEGLREQMRKSGIVVRAGSRSGLVEEAAEAYKDIDEVVRVVNALGIAKKVARLVPLAVIKG